MEVHVSINTNGNSKELQQLTQEEVDRVIEKMQALFHGQQEKQEVAG